MKKTCRGCKALEKNTKYYCCAYGFKIETICISESLGLVETKPLEECPKPKTTSEYVKYLKKFQYLQK